MHARTHAHIHTNTHTYANAHAHMYTRTCAHVHTHTHTHIHTHIYTHTYTHTLSLSLSLFLSLSHTHTHTHTCIHTGSTRACAFQETRRSGYGKSKCKQEPQKKKWKRFKMGGREGGGVSHTCVSRGQGVVGGSLRAQYICVYEKKRRIFKSVIIRLSLIFMCVVRT